MREADDKENHDRSPVLDSVGSEQTEVRLSSSREALASPQETLCDLEAASTCCRRMTWQSWAEAREERCRECSREAWEGGRPWGRRGGLTGGKVEREGRISPDSF